MNRRVALISYIFCNIFIFSIRGQETFSLRELLTGSTNGTSVRKTHAEFPGYDGWYNNLARPDSGAIDGPLLRRWPAAYEDGTYMPAGSNRPNPFDLSDQLLSGPIGSASRTGKNALLVYFGQQVVEEILDAQRPACPPEYFNIKIPKSHRYTNLTKHTEMPFLRTRFDHRTGLNPNNPRQQLNEITPYIDGGLMYGITKQWSDQLRTYRNGTLDPNGELASSYGGLFPENNTDRLPMANPPPPFCHDKWIKKHETPNVSRFFKLGNPRGNENPFLLTFGILWFRWHNYLAKEIKMLHKDWSSERIFNEARKWVIGTQQHIIIDEWLPAWTKPLPKYEKYDPSIDPQIDQFFQSAAFRFGHTLVTPGVYLRDYKTKGCKYRFKDVLGTNAVRTCNAFWRPQVTILKNITEDEIVDIDRLLMGMAYQLCEEEDHKIVEDLRGNVFGPLEFPRRDLMAINIQRGRDHGLPDFNSARRAFGLPVVEFDHFNQFNVDEQIVRNLRKLYGNVSNIDPWVGGILETVDGPGELFEAVILDQFRRIRDGDRFWYENKENGLFQEEEISRINNLKLVDIIKTVTKIQTDDIQLRSSSIFRVPKSREELGSCVNHMVEKNCSEGNMNFTCFHLPILNETTLNETCKDGSSYDYFADSETSFILTFTLVSAVICILFSLVYTLNFYHYTLNFYQWGQNIQNSKQNVEIESVAGLTITATEWIGPEIPSRMVLLGFNDKMKHLDIKSGTGQLLRSVDCRKRLTYTLANDKPYLIIMADNEYDLVLKFETTYIRSAVVANVRQEIEKMGYTFEKTESNARFKDLQPAIITKDLRRKEIEVFFRVVIAQAFKIKHNTKELLSVDNASLKIMNIELTLAEFADVLNMHQDDLFVTLMFRLIDQDKNGFLSFKEFLKLLTIFTDGTVEDKAKLLFDIYDIEAVGEVPIDIFKEMACTFASTAGSLNDNLGTIIDELLKKCGLQNRETLDFQDFMKIMGDNLDNLGKAKLPFKYGDGTAKYNQVRETIEDIYGTTQEIKQSFKINVENTEIKSEEISFNQKIIRRIGNKSKIIFWTSLYTFVLIAIFAERAYYYSVEREHSGLRQIAGHGVTLTRGAASAMMFTYSSLLVTMCRNIISYFRETIANNYIPFDYSVEFHKYIAYWALFFTVMHIIGHGFNFYHISTQTANDLTCLFRNYFHATHEFPKFHYWCWQTITGFTGMVLTLITAIIFIFAQPITRRKLYNWFWYTHALYPLFYIFMILHGAGRLIQEPYFHYFFLGPVILFAIDQAISIRRKKIEISVTNVKILPSNVTLLEICRPNNFEYKAGQWIRIACKNLNAHEYHPFTLSSSPQENNLTVHIRAVGPWTHNIRRLYDNAIQYRLPLPKIYIDGPFGEGYQDWHKYKVSILIGGGIGVTPFASILKDIVYRENALKISHNKVYFMWISKSQKQFEWLVEMLREIEQKDKHGIIQTHIYVTEFYEKFDIRSIMLYIFERHYQKLSNKSLFTNLEAVTHFGRPDFKKFLNTIKTIHVEDSNIGVFSCGSPNMISDIDAACLRCNNRSEGLTFVHHFTPY